ncbi:MAG: LysM peptidoglycan-binding domain-containing protein [Anaerolineales bacterium]|nr:LysM peptidoglycan-binding domain-containing protein [Anaerolineales bacterium]
MAVLLTEDHLRNATLKLDELKTAKPHHGVAVPLGDQTLITSPNTASDEDLPVGVELYNAAGELQQTIQDCPSLHGEAAWGEQVAFACEDGILWLEPQGDTFVSRKLAYPAGEGEELRAWSLAAHDSAPVLVGDFGENALIVIDPAAGTVTPVVLPAALWQFKFDTQGQYLLVVTVDGQVHQLDPVSGKVAASVAAVSPFTLDGEWSDPRPALAAGYDLAYVSDPAKSQVVEVDLETMQVSRQFTVAGTPVDLALLGASAEADTHEADEHSADMADQTGEGQDYLIQANDSLSKLAQRFYGNPTAFNAIIEATNAKAAEDSSYTTISNPSALRVGQKIFIPAAAKTTPGPQANSTLSTRLVVADIEAEKLYVYSAPEFELLGQFDGLQVADHAGFVVLPDGRVLLVDNKAQELLVFDVLNDQPQIVGRAKIPGAAVHLAVDPQGAYAAVSTSHDDESGQGKDALTRINLSTFETSEIPVATEEPGLLLGQDVILHRDGAELGQLQAFSLANLPQTGPEPDAFVDIGAFGHGEALINGHAYIATDDGVDVVHVEGGELEHEAVLPWNASGREGGRAYFVRVSPDGDHLWSYLRIVNNPDDDASWQNWQDWQNDVYLADLKTEKVTRLELGPGIVYRFALAAPYALYAQVHPNGDIAHLLDANPASSTFGQVLAEILLPALSHAPQSGVDPWDAAGFRVTAITPDGRWGFVSNGGDGSIAVIDTETRQIAGTITTPTPLNGGGYMVAVQPGQPLVDGVGR